MRLHAILSMAALTLAAAGSAQVKTTKKVTTKTSTSTTAVKSGPVFKSVEDSVSYAVGMNVGSSLQQAGLTQVNPQILADAISDVMKKNKTALTTDQSNMLLQRKLQEYAKQKSDAQKGEGRMFLEANSKRSGVTSLPDGLQYEVISAGEPNGAKPKAIDTVVVDYVGKLTNGTEFDNSIKRGQPATFPLNGVIKGWTEILQLMPKGANWRVYIPGDLAYGENPPPGAPIPPNAVLVFDITLHDIKPGTPPAQR